MRVEKRAVEDSVLWECPFDDPERLLPEGNDPDEEYYLWHQKFLDEPLMSALKALASRKDIWVGDEAMLYKAVESITTPAVRKSGPFPSGPKELMQHISDIEERSYAFFGAGLKVLDHRKLSGTEAARYHAPGWGAELPILVAKVGAATKAPLFYHTLFELARYEKPLVVAVLNSTRKRRHWSGPTLEMQRRLLAYYPESRPGAMAWFFRVDEWNEEWQEAFKEGQLPGIEKLIDEASYETPYSGSEDPYRFLDLGIDKWIGGWDHFSEHPESLDLLELYRLMDRYSPILKRVGIRVTRNKPSPEDRTRWTIEGPAWDFEDTEPVGMKLWFKKHAKGAARGTAR
jgi:hypothetical protein